GATVRRLARRSRVVPAGPRPRASAGSGRGPPPSLARASSGTPCRRRHRACVSAGAPRSWRRGRRGRAPTRPCRARRSDRGRDTSRRRSVRDGRSTPSPPRTVGDVLPLESVPNFSDGRDAATIDAIGRALEQHARLLDVHTDADHNRSVYTLVGTEGELADALAAGVAEAIERIDLG